MCSSSTFSTWNEPAIFYNRRVHVLFHVLHANFGVRFMSIGVEFVRGTKQTLKRKLFIPRWTHGMTFVANIFTLSKIMIFSLKDNTTYTNILIILPLCALETLFSLSMKFEIQLLRQKEQNVTIPLRGSIRWFLWKDQATRIVSERCRFGYPLS